MHHAIMYGALICVISLCSKIVLRPEKNNHPVSIDGELWLALSIWHDCTNHTVVDKEVGANPT